jgi:hypothetical protein
LSDIAPPYLVRCGAALALNDEVPQFADSPKNVRAVTCVTFRPLSCEPEKLTQKFNGVFEFVRVIGIKDKVVEQGIDPNKQVVSIGIDRAEVERCGLSLIRRGRDATVTYAFDRPGHTWVVSDRTREGLLCPSRIELLLIHRQLFLEPALQTPITGRIALLISVTATWNWRASAALKAVRASTSRYSTVPTTVRAYPFGDSISKARSACLGLDALRSSGAAGWIRALPGVASRTGSVSVVMVPSSIPGARRPLRKQPL